MQNIGQILGYVQHSRVAGRDVYAILEGQIRHKISRNSQLGFSYSLNDRVQARREVASDETTR